MRLAFTFAYLALACSQLTAQSVDALIAQPQQERLDSAYLINNTDSRAVDKKTGYMKGDLAALGRPVNPTEVILIAPPRAPDVAVELYCGIKKLPDYADAIRIQYLVSKDGKSAQFVSYVVERPMDTELATVKYDGPLVYRLDDAKPWIEWIQKSLLNDPTKKKETK
jgi:hypothetical protein